MSGSNINLTGTADLSQIDSAMLASAAAAQSMSSSTSESLNSLMSSTESAISALKSGLVQLQESYKTASASAKKSIQDHIESIEAQIIAQQSWVSVTSQTKTAFEDITVSATTTGQTLQQLINTTMGFDRIMASAADSSKIFATSLATQGVSATEAASAWEALGANITNLSGAQFGSLINSLSNVQTNFKSASSDGHAFAVEMQEIGQKIDTLTGAQFGGLTNKIAGVRDNFKSASSDGYAFTKEMRDLGENVRTLASRDMQSLIARTSGLSNEMRTGSEIGKELALQFGKIETTSKTSGEAMNNMGHVGSGALQELVRISRALLTGNFDRIPGEVMTLTTRLHAMSPAILGITAGFAGMTLVIYEAITALNHFTETRLNLESATGLTNSIIPPGAAIAISSRLKLMEGYTRDASAKITENLTSAFGMTTANAQFLSSIIGIYAGTEERAIALSKKWGDSFSHPKQGMAELILELDQSGSAIAKFNKIATDGGPNVVSQQRILMMSLLNDGIQKQDKYTKNLIKTDIEFQLAIATTGAIVPGMDVEVASKQKIIEINKLYAQSINSVTEANKGQARDVASDVAIWHAAIQIKAQAARDASAAQGGIYANEHQQSLAAAKVTQDEWQNRLASIKEGTKDYIAVLAAFNNSKRLVTEISTRINDLATATWSAKLHEQYSNDSANFSEKLQKDTKDHQLHTKKLLEHELIFWHSKLETTDLTEKQITYIHQQEDTIRKQIVVASYAHSGAEAKKSLHDQIADYTRRQAEAGKDFALVMQIEQAKLDFIRKIVGEKDSIYQNELKHSADLLNKHYEEEISNEAARLQRQNNIADIEIQIERKRQQILVNEHKISQDQMLSNVEAFAIAKTNIQIAEWEKFLETIPLEIRLNELAADKILLIRTNLDKKLASLEQEKSVKAKHFADTEARMWANAGDSIGNSIKNSMTGLIDGQTTWQKATQSILKSMVTEFISMTGTMMARWAMKEIFLNSTSAAGKAARTAMEADASATGFGAMIIAQIRDWLGMETVKTAGTAANTTARTAIQASGSVAGTAIQGTAALASIGTDAAVGGAGAYASLASIPYIGPILGAAAAVAAIGTIMGYKSMVKMDVGAWDVPKDMPAYIHAGEMVVPRNFADGMRSGSFGATGNTGNQGGDTNQTNHFNFSPTVHGGTDLNQQVMGAYRYFREVGRNGALALPGRKA